MYRCLVAVVLIAALGFTACSACVMESEVVKLWGGDLAVPTLLEVVAVSADCVTATFSGSVSVVSAEVVVGVPDGTDRAEQNDSVLPSTARIPLDWEGKDGGAAVLFGMERSPGPGVSAILSGVVKDAHGNSLSFASPFIGFNDRVPHLRISEIRCDYSKPKVEYIELRALTAGNLGGVEICNAMNEDTPIRAFPPVEVASGEFIVWHFRSVEEGLVSETGPLDESSGTNSNPSARDFWDTQARSPFKKTNVILLRERKGGPIMDALLCAESDKTDWPNDAVRAAAEEAVAAGAWLPGPLVSDAACTTGTTATRTLARDPLLSDTDTARDWKICATGKCSPGSVNAPH